MCNYEYINTKSCIFDELLNIQLPVDSYGLCPLHSNGQEWKESNNYHKHIKNIINIFLDQYYNNTINFEGVVFLPTEDDIRRGHFGERYLSFGDITFSNRVSFVNCIFLAVACFENSIFVNTADFSNSRLLSSTFKGVTFDKTYFRDAIFNGYADFSEAEFTQHVYFTNSIFHKRVYFQSASFKSHTCFTSATFSGVSNFHYVSFSDRWPVQFNKIILKDDAVLNFIGKKQDNRIFDKCSKGHVEFKIDKSLIDGKIIFKNADFHKINNKDILLELANHKIVEIDKNCGSHYEILISGVNISLPQFKIKKSIMESFSKFILNHSGFHFNVNFQKRHNGYQIIFDSQEYVIESIWEELKNEFEKNFNEICFDLLKNDKELKDRIKYIPVLPSNETPIINDITKADLQIDCSSLINRLKEYNNLGLLGRITWKDTIEIGKKTLNLWSG